MLDMDLELPTILVVVLASPTEAHRVSLDMVDMVAMEIMVDMDMASTRGRLKLLMDLLLDTMLVVESAIPTGAPRVSLLTEDMVATAAMVDMDTESTRGRLMLLTMAMELPLMFLSPALTTPTDME